MLSEINHWAKTGKFVEGPIDDTMRYSPRATRLMAHKVAANKNYGFPWAWESSIYLQLAGLIKNSEVRDLILSPGSILAKEYKLAKPELVANTDQRLRTVVLGSIKSAADAVEVIRAERPNAQVIFHHGKWNGIPHTGYLIGWLDIMNQLLHRSIFERNVVWVQSCDTNTAIADAGSVPFLNTRWRKTLNSYLPIDIVCSSGDFDKENADDYWAQQYRTLKPDFLVGVRGDPNTVQKWRRIRKMGLKTRLLIRNRIGDDTLQGGSDASVSQQHLKNFDYDLPLGLGSMKFIADEAGEGMFDRDVNWRQFLESKGFLNR